MIRDKQQNSRLHKLIGNLHIDKETKEELVFQFTKRRTPHSSEMTMEECQALINHLQVLDKQRVSITGTPPPRFANTTANKMRRKILSMCHEMNWKENGMLDWKKINAWLLKYGYLHKSMNDYNEQELPKLVTQFEKLLTTYYATK